MKNILRITATLLLLAITVSCDNVKSNKTTTLTVEGMSCAKSCVKKIETSLDLKEGVSEAKVDFEAKTVVISYDSTRVNEQDLLAVVAAAGDYKGAKTCDANCTKPCCADKKVKKKACKKDCTKSCCEK